MLCAALLGEFEGPALLTDECVHALQEGKGKKGGLAAIALPSCIVLHRCLQTVITRHEDSAPAAPVTSAEWP